MYKTASQIADEVLVKCAASNKEIYQSLLNNEALDLSPEELDAATQQYTQASKQRGAQNLRKVMGILGGLGGAGIGAVGGSIAALAGGALGSTAGYGLGHFLGRSSGGRQAESESADLRHRLQYGQQSPSSKKMLGDNRAAQPETIERAFV